MHRSRCEGELIMAKLLTIVSMFVIVVPLWSQTESSQAQPPVPAMVGLNNSAALEETYNPAISEDRMITPPPVSGQAYPVMLTSQERSNYLRVGLSFTGAYSDNVLGTVVG